MAQYKVKRLYKDMQLHKILEVGEVIEFEDDKPSTATRIKMLVQRGFIEEVKENTDKKEKPLKSKKKAEEKTEEHEEQKED